MAVLAASPLMQPGISFRSMPRFVPTTQAFHGIQNRFVGWVHVPAGNPNRAVACYSHQRPNIGSRWRPSGLGMCGAGCTARGSALEELQGRAVRRQQPDTSEKRLYVLDESSSSTRQMDELVERLRPNDRVLLVGDRREHEA